MSTISFAGLKAAPTKAKKEEKPSLPDPTGELSKLVNEGIEANKNEKAWVAASKLVKGQLGDVALRHAFSLYHGIRGPIEDSFKLRTAAGSATVSLKNAYKMPEDVAKVRPLLGEHADTYLRQSFVIELDSESIPVEMQQRFIDSLVSLAKQLDEEHALGSLSEVPETGGPIINAITVKQVVSVDKRFHEERHALFTPEQNMAIQAVMPCVTSTRYDY